MASKAQLIAWTDEATGVRYVQIEGKIYEQVGPAGPGHRFPEDPRLAGRGTEPGWQDAGGKKGGKRWQRAHKLQERQLSFKGGGKGGGKSSGQKQPPGATAVEGKGASKGTYKGSSRPKGGAHNLSTHRPWVPCCNPSCPGHQGKKSFKYVDSLGAGENGHQCMGCGTSWAESVKSQLAWGTMVGLSPATANHSLASTADSKSHFTAAEDINIVIKDAKPPTAPTAFRQLPEAARSECPKEFLPLLERHLLGSGLSVAELEPFKAAMEAGNDLGKRFMAAVAVGKAALEEKILPPTAAPRIQTRHGPITPAQEEAQAYSSWSSASAETQRQNKARHLLVNDLADIDHEEVVL